jgi:hypothetical protein
MKEQLGKLGEQGVTADHLTNVTVSKLV